MSHRLDRGGGSGGIWGRRRLGKGGWPSYVGTCKSFQGIGQRGQDRSSAGRPEEMREGPHEVGQDKVGDSYISRMQGALPLPMDFRVSMLGRVDFRLSVMGRLDFRVSMMGRLDFRLSVMGLHPGGRPRLPE